MRHNINDGRIQELLNRLHCLGLAAGSDVAEDICGNPMLADALLTLWRELCDELMG